MSRAYPTPRTADEGSNRGIGQLVRDTMVYAADTDAPIPEPEPEPEPEPRPSKPEREPSELFSESEQFKPQIYSTEQPRLQPKFGTTADGPELCLAGASSAGTGGTCFTEGVIAYTKARLLSFAIMMCCIRSCSLVELLGERIAHYSYAK